MVGGTNGNISHASEGGRREESTCLGRAMGEVIDVPEVLKSGSIFQAATKKDSTVMTVVFAHFIY